MTQVVVRLEKGNPYKSGSRVLLEVNGTLQVQIGFNIEDFARIQGTFNQNAAEFAYFASAIYGCDRAVSREISDGDRWTREFDLQIPVADPGKWSDVSNKCGQLLEFLTGDIWHIEFVRTQIPLFGREFRRTRRNFIRKTEFRGSAVSLYSGGLDSLVGVIDWLEENPGESLILSSTYDAQGGDAPKDQERLLRHLLAKYPGRIQRYVARTGLCSGGMDRNFRSRSLAYIGNAVLGASFISGDSLIVVPENGAIALNYPLTPARRGSLSTRTVHPHFIEMLGNLLNQLELRCAIRNPYLMKTKGEIIQECKNANLLRAAYADSISCGKRRHRVHWENRRARQCGACIPCILRRAAIHKARLEEERYGHSLNSGNALRKLLSQQNNDLSAIMDFVAQNEDANELWRSLRSNGRLEYSLRDQYISLVARLRAEISDWAQAKGLL